MSMFSLKIFLSLLNELITFILMQKQSIQLAILEDTDSTLLSYPLNIRKFLFDYKYSKFYECNTTLAAELVERLGETYSQNSTRNEKIIDGIKYFSRTIESLYKPYFLFGGSLLGKINDFFFNLKNN